VCGSGRGGVAFGDYNEGMKFRIVLEYDAEAQAYSAVCPELPGCASAGDTEEEAKQNITEAIELYLAPSDMELSRNAKLDEVTVG
jgi:predicted RNase H-like HicB family nuclease